MEKNYNSTYHHKPWKRFISLILSLIIAFGTFVTMTFGNLLLSDYVDFHNLIVAEAALSPKPLFYRYGELVGLYRLNYNNTTTIQYKIGENGTWTNYSVPFSIPAFETTRVYARIGTNGAITYDDFTTTNQAIGVYTESATDFDFSYNGINFGYTRIYNSADKNWFESIHSKVATVGSYLKVYLPDGTEYPLIRTGANTYVDQITGKTLTKSSTEYVFDDGEYKYHFGINLLNSVAYLSGIEDNNGNILNLTRTTNIEEASISDGTRTFEVSDYEAVEATNDPDVNYYSVKTITDPNGNDIEYTTKWGRYINVTDQAGVTLGQYQYVSTASDYTMTKSNNKTIEYYTNGRLKKVTEGNGEWIQYAYDDENMTYTTLSSSGETTSTTYNDAFYTTSYTDKYGISTNYTYDNHYRVLTQICDGKTTTYTYDTNGNLTSYIVSDENNNTFYTYDSHKRIVRKQVGNEYTYYTYDNNGNNLVYATLKEDYTGTAPALYDSTLTCFDTTTYTYDNKGRVTSEVYSTGGSVSYTYDSTGNMLTETSIDADNNQTTITYTYDAFGNVLTTSKGTESSSYTYDAAGRILLSNEDGECKRTLYDNQGRVIQMISPEDYDSTKEGLPTSNTYADENVGHRYVYDSNTGNLTSETNRLGVQTTYTYFSTGEKQTEEFDKYKFCYNVKGAVTQIYVNDINTLTYNYNENCKLTSEVYANGQSIRYEYDNDGNLKRQYHNSDSTAFVTYTYNEDGELTQKVNTDTGLRYEYAGDDYEVYKVSDNTLVYSYSATEIEEDETNQIEAETDIFETHFGASYSSVIKSDSISYTKGNHTLEYSFTENDDTIIEDTVKYDGNSSASSEYTYNSNGNTTQKSLEYGNNTIEINNVYDNKNRITESGYDSSDRAYYSYDSNSQITRVDNNILNCTSAYTYDSHGNILTKSVYGYTRNDILSNPTETTTFTYSNDGWNDKLIAVNNDSLTYDSIGNVLSYGNKTFTWTSGRNLASITDGNNTYSYTYDENGIRTSKTVNGTTTYFNTKDGIILSQTDGTNALYFQYDNNGTPIGFIYNGTQYLYLTNQMGDVISITDAQGNELVQYEYNEWGGIGSITTTNNTATENTLANINPIRYRGYYYDNETQYYYLQSRYYNPYICRFINADRVDYTDKERHCGNNLYAYCANNPIIHKDPSGHFLLIIMIILAISKSNINSVLSPYLSKIVSASTKNKYGTSNKGKIRIDLNYSSSFVSDLHSSYKSNPSATARIIAEYGERKFKNVLNRDIVFDTNCLEREINIHIAAFLIAKKYRDISKPNGISASAFNKIIEHATPVDILEADVYNGWQTEVFSYFYGIRSKYYKTKKDPYYYYTGLIKNRDIPANPSWRTIKL